MKRILIALLLLTGFQFAEAQADTQTDTIPAYKKYPVIPVFTIMTAPDSLKFTKENMQKSKPTVIMLFSPDCSHCKLATEDILKHIDLFKNAQIIMVSSLDFSNIKKFYKEFNMSGFPNITVGRDGSYTLGTFYKLKTYPTLFVYDKKGEFVKTFSGDIKMQEVAESL